MSGNYTDCHINVPKKGWRHKCCSKKSAPQSERFFDNHYTAEMIEDKCSCQPEMIERGAFVV